MPSGPRSRLAPSSSRPRPSAWVEPGRTRAQVAVATGRRPPRPHDVDAFDRLARRAAAPRPHHRSAERDDVRAPVHAVGEVHVQPPRRPEHRRGARRPAPVRVAPGVDGAAVRLDLDDADREPALRIVVHEQLVQQQRRELERIARVERAGQPSSHCCWRRNRSRSRARAAPRPGPGPAPPGVVRRRTARPGLEQRERVRRRGGARPRPAPRAGCAARSTAGRATRPPRAPRGTASRRARGARPGRSPTTTATSAAARIRATSKTAGVEQPAQRQQRERRASRPRRTAAPCPPAGRGCTRAGAPSAWPAAR